MIPVLGLALLRATGTGRWAAVPCRPDARAEAALTPARAPSRHQRNALRGLPRPPQASPWPRSTAAAPSLLVPAMTVVVSCALVFLGRRGRTVWWALLPSLALFLPFAFSVL